MTEKDIEHINEKLDTIIAKQGIIYAGLYGVAGTEDKGVCGDVKDLKEDYYQFKQKAMLIFFFLLGSGVLGVGIWELIKIL